MKKEIKEKIIKRPPKWFYKQTFDMLMEIGMRDLKIPKKLLTKFDEVADYLGDIATGRIK